MANEITNPDTLSRLAAMMKVVNKENPTDEHKQELRALLQGDPSLVRQVKSFAQANITSLLAEANMPYDVREFLRAEALDIRQQLEFDTAPMLEQLLIESLVLCWLRLALYENVVNQKAGSTDTMQVKTFWERRLSAAHSRFLRACEALARVRRLARNDPSLQVNVGVGIKVER